LRDAQFVALDVETTGNAPFLVLEIGAERFRLDRTLSFFDTLVDCRAPINPYARKRHHIDRSMLIGAPEFKDARRAFLRFAQGARATAMVFRELIRRAREMLGWAVVGDVLSALPRPVVDRTPPSRRGSAAAASQSPDARGRTAPPRSAAPPATPRATSRAPSGRRGRSSRRRRSGSSGSPGGSRA